jgi:hypothetical protein
MKNFKTQCQTYIIDTCVVKGTSHDLSNSLAVAGTATPEQYTLEDTT